MSTIVTTPMEIFNAYSFVKRLRDGSDIVYVAIGREAAWPDDLNPPVPVKTQEEIENFWDGVVGMQRVQIADLELMVPRIQWAAGLTTLELFDKTDAAAFSTNFYVVNQDFEVYQVTTVPVDTVLNPTVTEPSGHNSGAEILTGDGYGYTYLFTVSLQDVEFRVNDDWIPVPILAEIVVGSDQDLYGDKEAYKTLGAKYAYLRMRLLDSGSAGLPDITYRQIAIIVNPLLATTSPATATVVDHAVTPLQLYSGDLVHLENRPPIIRISGQFEETNLIFDF